MSPFSFTGPVEIIAHRGYSACAPENTLAALSAAVEAGADAVEFDLQVTRDGIAVLFHDDDLDRTTDGRGPIGRATFTSIATLDAGRWFSAEFAGERVPTLESALELLSGGTGHIYAEIKESAPAEAVDDIVAVTAAAGASDRTVFISMDWSLLARVRAADEAQRIGYIVRNARDAEAAVTRAKHDARALLDFDARILLANPSLARRVADVGIPMATWTVDEPARATRLLEMGVPRITTNQVGSLLDWKAAL